MKKILILIAVVVVGVIIYKIIIPPPVQTWTNNIVSAKCVEFKEQAEEPVSADIFIDASGSMKPYFLADDKTITNAVSEIVNLNTKATKIYFLGTPTPYKGLVVQILSSVQKQPNLSATTFHKYFEDIANEMDTVKNKIAYLVTDGIISVNGIDTKDALLQMQGKITTALEGHDNIAGAIFRYEGGYKGNYWNSRNQTITLKGEMTRPFYIIALGSKEVMRWLNTKSESLNTVKAKYFMGIHDTDNHNKITDVYNLEPHKIQYFNKPVTCVLQLPECLRDYDLSNSYAVINNKKIDDAKIEKEDINARLYIDNTKVSMSNLVSIGFVIPNVKPTEWYTIWNNEDDIKGPDSTTTFGLSTLVDGMSKALEPNENLMNIEFKFIYK